MKTLRHRAIKPVAATLALAAIVVFDPTPPAQAQGYLRAAPYGRGIPYGYGIPYSYEYYLPSDQHRFYDRGSIDFNS